MRINRATELTKHFSSVGDEYVMNLKLVRHAPEEEAIHDLRVATRRLSAMVHACGAIFHGRESRDFFRDTRRLMRCLGEMRDAQLKFVEVEKMRKIFRQLAPLLDDLRKEKKRAEKKLVKMVKGYRPAKYRHVLLMFEKDMSDYGMHHELAWQNFRNSIGFVVNEYQAVFKEKSRSLDTNNPSDLHALRIKAKKARYLLEMLPALFGCEPSGLEAIKGLQAILGEIQDCSTLVDDIDDFLKRKWMYQESIGPIRNELEQKIQRLASDVPMELSRLAAALAKDVCALSALRQQELLPAQQLEHDGLAY